MSFHPIFRFEPSSSELTLRPSAAAEIFLKQGSASGGQVKRADVVRAEARARAWSKYADNSEQAVLAESELQIGQYRDQTFQWLLSNNVGFAVKILASHQKEREGGDTTTTPQMLNKDALASYAGLYPPMVTPVARRRLCEGSLSAGAGLGDMLVGFGAHSQRTYKSLYDARDQESQTYVAWIRKQKVGARSRMEALKMYVPARDKEPKTAPEPAHVLPPPGVALQQTASGKELLPLSWRQTLPEEQQEWVG
ncbi:uncharacterized protein LOC121711205 [Alosa sapidissima]|uniref:uncharacterized protein LOC121711205 n=1 Tax=Alosa sapidissima TaxID=34773 RepID=UPI001C08A3F4|nr:uncharacterized protein LOC121711205 [Alosa sapidissima]